MVLVMPRVMGSRCVVLCVRKVHPSCLNLFLFLSSAHFLTLLFSPFHKSSLPSPSLSCASHFAVYCRKPASLWGSRLAGLKTQAGFCVVAAERDGYNNPYGESTHVLNYCHKCSSIRPRQDHQGHSAISSPDALSFSVT